MPEPFELPPALSRAEAADLSADQIYGHSFPLLTPRAAVRNQALARCTYARPHGPDLLELLVYRNGECLRRLTDDDVATVETTDLFGLARERLRLIPAAWEVVRCDQAELHVLRGASTFTASKLTLLPDVLRPALGRKIKAPSGALVSVPSRHELVCAPVDVDIPATLVHLARYTLMTYEDCRDPLSPNTYWWHNETLTPVVTLEPGGFVDFRLPPAFYDAAGTSPLGESG